MSDPTFAFDQSQEQAARREAIRDWQERHGETVWDHAGDAETEGGKDVAEIAAP